MMTLTLPFRILEPLLIGLCGWLLVDLRRKGLQSSLSGLYRFVACHLSAAVLLSSLSLAHVRYYYYGLVFWIVQPFLWVAALYLVLSLWKLGFYQYKGIHVLCIGVVSATMAGVMAVVAISTRPGQGGSTDPGNWLNMWFQLVNRSIFFLEAAFLIALMIVIKLFPIQTKKTYYNLAMTFLIYALTLVGLQSWLYFGGRASGTLGGALNVSATILLMGAWSLTVHQHQRGEDLVAAPVYVGLSRRNVEDRLESMNDALIAFFRVR